MSPAICNDFWQQVVFRIILHLFIKHIAFLWLPRRQCQPGQFEVEAKVLLSRTHAGLVLAVRQQRPQGELARHFWPMLRACTLRVSNQPWEGGSYSGFGPIVTTRRSTESCKCVRHHLWQTQVVESSHRLATRRYRNDAKQVSTCCAARHAGVQDEHEQEHTGVQASTGQIMRYSRWKFRNGNFIARNKAYVNKTFLKR